VSDPRAPSDPRRHLLSIADLGRGDVARILDTATSLAASLDREMKKLPTLRGRTVVNLFYESSTRTLASFELAAKRLSADTMSIRSSGSSVDKGESLKDTALTLAAYDPDVIVVRHPSIGAPQLVARHTDAHVVNAGDGKHQHPTQALLDLYTMRHALGRLEGVRVAIVGDVLHSRVARSLVQALALVGGESVLVGPPTLIPRGIDGLGCEVSNDIAAIDGAASKPRNCSFDSAHGSSSLDVQVGFIPRPNATTSSTLLPVIASRNIPITAPSPLASMGCAVHGGSATTAARRRSGLAASAPATVAAPSECPIAAGRSRPRPTTRPTKSSTPCHWLSAGASDRPWNRAS